MYSRRFLNHDLDLDKFFNGMCTLTIIIYMYLHWSLNNYVTIDFVIIIEL